MVATIFWKIRSIDSRVMDVHNYNYIINDVILQGFFFFYLSFFLLTICFTLCFTKVFTALSLNS